MAQADFFQRDFSRADWLAGGRFDFATLHRQTATAAHRHCDHVAQAGVARRKNLAG